MNNYLLRIADHINIIGYISQLITQGMQSNLPFTIELIEPSILILEWQPGQPKPAYKDYSKKYQRWYRNQQFSGATRKVR